MKKVSIVAIQHPEFPHLFLHGLRADSGKYNLIGGHAEPGETEVEAARREAREESGLEIREMEHCRNGCFPDSEDDEGMTVSLFVAKLPHGTIICPQDDPDKEFVPGSFKFIDPLKNRDLHVPAKKNLLVQFLKSRELKKEMWNLASDIAGAEEDGRSEEEVMEEMESHPLASLHGWIDPDGDFHDIHPLDTHGDFHGGNVERGIYQPARDGWIGCLHGGQPAFTVSDHHLNNPNGDAMKKLREKLKEHREHLPPELEFSYVGKRPRGLGPYDISPVSVINVDTDSFIRTGFIPHPDDVEDLAASAKAVGEPLDKIVYREALNERQPLPMVFHNVISPTGKVISVGPKEYHHNTLKAAGVHGDDVSVYDNAIDAGWIAGGAAGDWEFAASPETLANPRHPAVLALRRLLKQHDAHTPSSININGVAVDTSHFAKHGIGVDPVTRKKRDFARKSENPIGQPLQKMPKTFTGTPRKPFKTVWRVQDAEGSGPYTGGAEIPDEDETPEIRPEPRTEDKGFTAEDKRTLATNPDLKFGFDSEETMRRWFNPESLKVLAEQGYKPTKVKASEVWSSGRQLFFRKFVQPHRSKLKKSFEYSDGDDFVLVRPGSTRLRAARDIAAQGNDRMVHVKELKRQGHDTAALGLTRFQDPRKVGYISADKIHEAIHEIPEVRFDVSHGRYTGNKQKHSVEDQNLLVVKLPEDKYNGLSEGARKYLQTYNQLASQSGHPTHDPRTLGWVRYTKGPDGHIHVDEVQTDLHAPLSRKVESEIHQLDRIDGIPEHMIAAALQQGAIDENQANLLRQLRGPELQRRIAQGKNYISSQDHLKDEHHVELMRAAFGEKHPNEMIHEAFLEHLRQDPANIGKTVALWHAGPKAELTLFRPDETPPAHMLETYTDQPKKMGYKPGEYGQIQTQSNPQHQGKKTWQQALRKALKRKGEA